MTTTFLKHGARCLAAAACMLATGCGPVADAWMTGRTAAAAEDQIMLVRADPPSFGFQRLQHQSGVYPDLGLFLSQNGLPDFLAETTGGNRHYLILYYLKKRQAYACRTLAARTRDVEFAGPYPITDKEYKLLTGFQKEAARRRAAQ